MKTFFLAIAVILWIIIFLYLIIGVIYAIYWLFKFQWRKAMNDDSTVDKGYSRYYWYKEHGVCVKCGQTDARHGKTLCVECAEKQKERCNKPMSEEQKQRAKAKKAQRRDSRIEQGLCPNCGKRPSVSDGLYCEFCRAYHRRKKEIENRKKGVMPKFLFGEDVDKIDWRAWRFTHGKN